MESSRCSAKNKQSLIAIGALMLSLAALQSPLWRPHASDLTVVRSGGATLISSDSSIAEIALDQTSGATAEVVGGYQVLIRGTAPGETRLQIAFQRRPHQDTYRVIVRSESSTSSLGAIVSRQPG